VPSTPSEQDKWQRYEQALLAAMRSDQGSPGGRATEYHMLILPAFDAPCCVHLALTNRAGELRLSLLGSHVGELFAAIWHARAEAEAQAIRLAAQSCLVDTAHLSVEQVESVRRRLAALEPQTLGNIDLAARDGLSLRFEGHDQNRDYMFSMRSPTAQEAPRHRALVELFLEAAQAHAQHQRLRDYLAGLRRYLH
jgi:hypothetical protein